MKKCLFCNKLLPQDRWRHLRKFCNRDCQRWQRYGGKPSAEKIRECKDSWGKRRENGLDIPWNKGKEGSKGDKNYFWKGGKRAYLKRKVHEKYDYTCQDCGLREELKGFMDIDHIISQAKNINLKYKLSNLVTLCPNCHRRKTLKNYELHNFNP